jgi:hypothetical protein
MSLIWGELDGQAAARMINRPATDQNDVARHCLAADLRRRGFVVTNTPSRWNPDHVSATVPGGVVRWDDEQVEQFALAFADYAARKEASDV